MPEKQPSAEKDLLKLIENPSAIEPNKPVIVGGKVIHQGTVKKISFFSKMKRVATPGPAKKSRSVKEILTDRKLIVRVLFLVTACFFVYFVVTVAQEFMKVKNTKNLVKFTYISEGKEAGSSGTPSLEVDLTGSSAPPEAGGAGFRNIFKISSAKKEEEKKDDAAVVLSDYRLVGISLGTDSEETYAMVKNAKTNITYFLKKGEKLDGMELMDIFDNKLSLKIKGQVVELR